MNGNLILSIISVSITGLSIVTTAVFAFYELFRGQAFEKEKTKLDIYSNFLAYCTIRNSQCMTLEEMHSFYHAYTKVLPPPTRN